MEKPTLDELEARRAELRGMYLRPVAERSSPGRGIHHAALICSDVEQTIRFYQDVLGFPLVELVENRDYQGSSHFFFDLGNQTLLGFFDFPGLGLEPGIEAIGGVQHIAANKRDVRVGCKISVLHGVPVPVIEDYKFVVVHQAAAQRGANEPCAARHKKFLSSQ